MKFTSIVNIFFFKANGTFGTQNWRSLWHSIKVDFTDLVHICSSPFNGTIIQGVWNVENDRLIFLCFSSGSPLFEHGCYGKEESMYFMIQLKKKIFFKPKESVCHGWSRDKKKGLYHLRWLKKFGIHATKKSNQKGRFTLCVFFRMPSWFGFSASPLSVEWLSMDATRPSCSVNPVWPRGKRGWALKRERLQSLTKGRERVCSNGRWLHQKKKECLQKETCLLFLIKAG